MIKFFRGVGWRIFVGFSALLLALVAVMSIGGLHFGREMIRTNADNELRVLSITLSNQIKRYLDSIENGLTNIKYQDVLIEEVRKSKPDTEVLDIFLKQHLYRLHSLQDLAIFDEEGHCLATTDPDWVGFDASKDAFFLKGKKGYYFADPFDTKDEGKIQLVSAPIKDGRKVYGVLVGQVHMGALYDIMSQHLGLRGNAEAFILDSRLRFVTPGRSGPNELIQSHLADTPLVQHLQEEFWVGQYRNYDGDNVIGTVGRVEGFPWYLVIERDVEEVENQFTKLQHIFLGLMIFLVFGLFGTTYILTRSITKPLQKLVAGARRIAEGDLVHPISIPRGPDEVAYLAAEFDRMRMRIATYQGQLLERLEESEQKRIESERMASIGTLAATLAHEIRNPLNAMSLTLSQIERSRDDSPAFVKEKITNLKIEIARLDRLVTDILDYAKPLRLSFDTVDLKALVDSVLLYYKNELKEKNIETRINFTHDEMVIKADRDRLKQCFVNILRNSVEALAENGLIEVSGSLKEQDIELAFHDNGRGIPENEQKRLFDLFFTTKQQGTGLGLSLVRKIMDAHRGRIRVDSTQNIGTTVYLSFPRL